MSLFLGFHLSGRISRTEWRVRRRQEDLGDFAAAIDKTMEEREHLSMDHFFVVAAHWAGVDDEDEDEVDEPPDVSGLRTQETSGLSNGYAVEGSSCQTTRTSDPDGIASKCSINPIVFALLHRPPQASCHGLTGM